MTDLEHATPPSDFIGMIFGKPGVGKTSVAMGLAQKLRGDGDILYLDSSDGWITLKGKDWATRNVKYLSVTDTRELPPIANAVANRHPAFKNVRVVILDEYTSMVEDAMERYLREEHNVAPDQPLPELVGKDWSAIDLLTTAIINQFHKIPNLHIILVGHGKKQVKKEVEYWEPNLTPKIQSKVLGKMHLCGFVNARFSGSGEHIREIQCQPSALVVAKSRISGMPTKMALPAFVDTVVEWVHSDEFATDVTDDEPQVAPEDDTQTEQSAAEEESSVEETEEEDLGIEV
jgi:hypothetical protein